MLSGGLKEGHVGQTTSPSAVVCFERSSRRSNGRIDHSILLWIGIVLQCAGSSYRCGAYTANNDLPENGGEGIFRKKCWAKTEEFSSFRKLYEPFEGRACEQRLHKQSRIGKVCARRGPCLQLRGGYAVDAYNGEDIGTNSALGYNQVPRPGEESTGSTSCEQARPLLA